MGTPQDSIKQRFSVGVVARIHKGEIFLNPNVVDAEEQLWAKAVIARGLKPSPKLIDAATAKLEGKKAADGLDAEEEARLAQWYLWRNQRQSKRRN